MDDWRRFARVKARIKGEITKTLRENDILLRRLTSMHIKKIDLVSAGFTRARRVFA
jgi:hypothetical protein